MSEKWAGMHSQRPKWFSRIGIPESNRVGAEGQGFKFAMSGLDGGRINIGACSLGGAQAALEMATEYTKERKQFSTRIADFQALQISKTRNLNSPICRRL